MNINTDCSVAVKFQVGIYNDGDVTWLGKQENNFITPKGLDTLKYTYFADMTKYVYLGTGINDEVLSVIVDDITTINGKVVGDEGFVGVTSAILSSNIGKAIVLNNGVEGIILSLHSELTDLTYKIKVTKRMLSGTMYGPAKIIPVNMDTLSAPVGVSSLCDTTPGTVNNIKSVDGTTSEVTITNTRSIIFPPASADINYKEIGWSHTNLDGLNSNLFGRKDIDISFKKGDMPYVRVSIIRKFDCSEAINIPIDILNITVAVSTRLLLYLPEFNEDYYSTIDADGSLIPPMVKNTLFEPYNTDSTAFSVIVSDHAKELNNDNVSVWDELSVYEDIVNGTIVDILMYDRDVYYVFTTSSVIVYNRSNAGIWEKIQTIDLTAVISGMGMITKVYRNDGGFYNIRNINISTTTGAYIIEINHLVSGYVLRYGNTLDGECLDNINNSTASIMLYANNKIQMDIIGLSVEDKLYATIEHTMFVPNAIQLVTAYPNRFLILLDTGDISLFSYTATSFQVTGAAHVVTLPGVVLEVFQVYGIAGYAMYIVKEDYVVKVLVITDATINIIKTIDASKFPDYTVGDVRQINRTLFHNSNTNRLYRFNIDTMEFRESITLENTDIIHTAHRVDTGTFGVDDTTIRLYNNGTNTVVSMADVPLNIQDKGIPKAEITPSSIHNKHLYDEASYVGAGNVIAISGSKLELLSHSNGTLVSMHTLDMPEDIVNIVGKSTGTIIAYSATTIYLLGIVSGVLYNFDNIVYPSVQRVLVLSSGRIVVGHSTTMTELYINGGGALSSTAVTADLDTSLMVCSGMEVNDCLYPNRFYVIHQDIGVSTIDVSNNVFDIKETITTIDQAAIQVGDAIQDVFAVCDTIYFKSSADVCYPFAIVASGLIKINQSIGNTSSFIPLSDSLLVTPSGANVASINVFNGKDVVIAGSIETYKLNNVVPLPNNELINITSEKELIVYFNINKNNTENNTIVDVDFLYSNIAELKSIMVVPGGTEHTETVQYAQVFDTPLAITDGRIDTLSIRSTWYRELV